MQEITRLTKTLIRFKTMPSRPGEIQRCAEFIEDWLKVWDIDYRRLAYGKVPSILALPQNNFTPILLMTHIDVVDAPDDLFKPLEKEQQLYGRGSLDDKYAVALSLVLLKRHLQRLRKQGKGQKELPFGILITADEEIGGFNGAGKALEKVQTDFCIVLDGGSIEKIVVKERGVARIKLVSKGKAAVGKRPWLGDNAIEKLIDDFIKIKTYFVKSVAGHIDRAVILKSIRTDGLHHPVPEFAEADLDIRYVGNEDLERFFAKMQQELHSRVVVESIEPLFPDGESYHLNLLLDLSKRTKIGFEDGLNDARFLARYGLKGIIWGANGNHSRHSLSEHVDLESVEELYRILDEFMIRQSESKHSYS
ncbi:MAG: M20 family metallopeptidase [Proteobacteria bacterium]|nr:M20 family metallopeptidase [Pseudomonadota bacterium]